MRIRDESVLDLFRGPGVCEWCLKTVRCREPHHIIARGMGGGRRIDHPLNLVALCATFAGGNDCHHGLHNGQMRQGELFALVAKREGCPSGAVVESAVRSLINLPKGSPMPQELKP